MLRCVKETCECADSDPDWRSRGWGSMPSSTWRPSTARFHRASCRTATDLSRHWRRRTSWRRQRPACRPEPERPGSSCRSVAGRGPSGSRQSPAGSRPPQTRQSATAESPGWCWPPVGCHSLRRRGSPSRSRLAWRSAAAVRDRRWLWRRGGPPRGWRRPDDPRRLWSMSVCLLSPDVARGDVARWRHHAAVSAVERRITSSSSSNKSGNRAGHFPSSIGHPPASGSMILIANAPRPR